MVFFARLAVLLLSSPAVWGVTFEVHDADGNPVSDVVITAGERRDAETTGAVIDQVDREFTPYVSVLPADAAVRFPNRDQVRHHVYSFSDAKTFELKLYKGEPQEPVIFDKPGIAVLGCNIHDNMIAYVYVTDKALYGKTQGDGQVSFPGPAPELITVWHPALSLDGQAEFDIATEELQQSSGVLQVVLPVSVPSGNPQAVDPNDFSRFQQFSR